MHLTVKQSVTRVILQARKNEIHPKATSDSALISAQNTTLIRVIIGNLNDKQKSVAHDRLARLLSTWQVALSLG